MNYNIWILLSLLISNYLLPGEIPFDHLTLEEKIGQILMVHFYGEKANSESNWLINELHVGGLILYNWCNDLSSLEQVKDLTSSLQKQNQINFEKPVLLISVDQEGGVVERLKDGVHSFPGNYALGKTQDFTLAHYQSSIMAQDLRRAGVNMNLAPVCDIHSNFENPIIGIRSFGDNPELVTTYVSIFLQNFKKNQIVGTLKHFPGIGDVEVDPHESLPILDKSLDELNQLELIPFKRLAHQADAIMTAHVLIPQIDPENCVTLSKKALDILRTEMGFEGLIVSDSLVMQGVLDENSQIEDVCLKAFLAGCDILILGGKLLTGEKEGQELKKEDLKKIQKKFLDAVHSGMISLDRLEASAKRILLLKNRLILRSENSNEINVNYDVSTEIARKSVEIIKNKSFQITKLEKIRLYAPECICSKLNDAIDYMSLDQNRINDPEFLAEIDDSDLNILISYKSMKDFNQIFWINFFVNLNKPTVLVITDNTDHNLFSEDANFVIKTFSPSEVSLRTVLKIVQDLENLEQENTQ